MPYDAAKVQALQQQEANRIRAAAGARGAGSFKPASPVVNNSNYGPSAGEGRQAISSRDIALAAMNARQRPGVNPDGSWTDVMSGFPEVLRDGTPNPRSSRAPAPIPQAAPQGGYSGGFPSSQPPPMPMPSNQPPQGGWSDRNTGYIWPGDPYLTMPISQGSPGKDEMGYDQGWLGPDGVLHTGGDWPQDIPPGDPAYPWQLAQRFNSNATAGGWVGNY